jgi:LuxR family maltose regulon positive regulatory protein
MVERLTLREQEVLDLLAQRLRDKEIAEKLFVATETVKSHLKHIYEKLAVRSRREAVARAGELGLVSPP